MVVGTKYMIVGTKIYMVVRTNTLVCGNKNLWLLEQIYFNGKKIMVGETNHRLWEQNPMIGITNILVVATKI
jgi:hypothetical protein